MSFQSGKYGANPTLRVTLSAPGASAPFIVPTECSMISVGLVPGANGKGRVEYTLSSPELVDAQTAVWRAWPHGDVVTLQDDALAMPVVAIRLVCVEGAVTLEAVGN